MKVEFIIRVWEKVLEDDVPYLMCLFTDGRWGFSVSFTYQEIISFWEHT